MRSLFIPALIFWLLGMLLCPFPGRAASEDARRVKSVGILPLRDFSAGPESLFNQERAQPQRLQANQLLDEIALVLSRESRLKIYSGQSLRMQVSSRNGYREQVLLGRERYSLGRDHFLALRQDEALANLEKAATLLGSVFYDLNEVNGYSEVLEILGVSLVESGREGDAHVVFRRMFHSNPEKRFVRGYYPAPVEEALTAAYSDLFTSMERSHPFIPSDEIELFLRSMGLDVVLFPILVSSNGETQLQVIAYEAPYGYTQWKDGFTLSGQDRDQEQVRRLASRWLSCTPFKLTQDDLRQTVRSTYLTASFVEESFIQFPTRTYTGELGFSLEMSHQLLPNLQLSLQIATTTSLGDSIGDLLKGYSLLRGVFGPLFTLDLSRFQLYGGLGVATYYIGSIEVTTSPDCKFFDSSSTAYSIRCSAADVNTLEPSIMFGGDVRLGTRFFITEAFFFDGSVSSSLLVIPFSRSSEMNFPVMLHAGLGVGF